MRHGVSWVFLGILVGRMVSGTAEAKDLGIWAVGDGEKILRGALDHPARKGNAVWNGKRVSLFGARNEFAAFQFVVPAEREPVTVSSVNMKFKESDLAVEILSEHYIQVSQASPSNREGGWFWHRNSAPKFTPGWIPDALVPLSAKEGRGGLPIRIEKGNSQAFWVDIAIPRSGVSPRVHRAELEVRTSAGSSYLPVELEVLDATLPDKDVIKTMIYFSDVERRHGRKDKELLHAYRVMAHRHRFDLVEYVAFEDIEDYKPYLTGEAYSKASGYMGPGEGLGQKVLGVDFYGGTGLGKTKEEYWATSDKWVKWFEANAPDVVAFYYLTDEPPKSRFDLVRERASWVHSNPGVGRKLPVLVTTRPQEDLEGAVDIWATVANQVDLEDVGPRREKGQRWWFYNGQRPCSGAMPFDAPAVDFRVQPWICWLYGVELWFYWEATHWQHNHQGPRSHQDQNVWIDPVTFTSSVEIRVNGDGTLFYPGEDAIFKDQDRGVTGPISSIRMKNLRRGQQDVALIQLAIAAGKEEEACAVARKLIPRAFSDVEMDDPLPWPEKGDAWENARRAVADLLR